MSKILVLKSSLNGVQSLTSTLIDDFLAERRQKGHADLVTEHDLAGMDLPELDGDTFSAMRGAPEPGIYARKVVALSDRLIEELKGTDIVVMAAPMYNHNVPSPLKNWFDLVSRAGKTFRYTETYPMGLIEGVRAVVVSSRGGFHVNQPTDAVTPYLRAVLSLMGINEVDFIYAEGMDIKPHGRDKGIAEARQQISQLVS